MDSNICWKPQNISNFTNIELYELRLRLWIVAYVGNLKILVTSLIEIAVMVAYVGNLKSS